jgi:alkylhydroperoxidase family enzyme
VARHDIPPGEGGDAVQVWSLQPELGRAATRLVDAADDERILGVRVREAARVRIAQLDDCTVRLASRADSVRAQGLHENLHEAVGSGGDGRFSEQERLAVEFAERFALDHADIDDAFVQRLRGVFSDPEVFDLTVCVSAFLGLGRTPRVLGIIETSLTDV